MFTFTALPENVNISQDTSPVALRVSCGRHTKAALMGLVAIDGNIHCAYPTLPALFLFYNQGAVIKETYDLDHIASARAVVSGLALLVREGKPVPRDPHSPARIINKPKPFVGVGINKAGELVIHCGTGTYEDAQKLFLYLRVKDALLLTHGDFYLEKRGEVVRGKMPPPIFMTAIDFAELKRPIILLDPGHGGADPGAAGNGLIEKNLNLFHAKYIASALSGFDCTVLMTRYDDTTLSLEDRAVLARVFKPDLFLSIHANAGGGTGYESYIHPNAHPESESAQEIIHTTVSKRLGELNLIDRGRKRENFAMLRVESIASMLVEMLFVDNWNDSEAIKNPTTFGVMSLALARGICEYLNLQPREVPVPEKPKLWRVQVGAFKSKENAINLAGRLRVSGYDPYVLEQ